MDFLALGLLVAALLVFLLSTKQFELWVRVLIWLGGVGLLVAASASALQLDGHYGMLRAISDLFSHWQRPSESVIASAINGNSPNVRQYLAPVLDFAIAVGGALALIVLFALTPGEKAEKAVRPWLHGLIGVIVGGVATLAVVAVGLGGHQNRNVFVAAGGEIEVIDGDTLRMGEVSLRLFGIDAFERRQTCLGNPECGAAARNLLLELIAQRLVLCRRVPGERDPYGRPIVRCEVRGNGNPIQINEEMLAHNFAIRRGEDGETIGDTSDLDVCTLSPSVWRGGGAVVDAFKNEGVVPEARSDWIGDCDVRANSDNRR
jgi:endonuclease YncB( thermonuclease family)